MSSPNEEPVKQKNQKLTKASKPLYDYSSSESDDKSTVPQTSNNKKPMKKTYKPGPRSKTKDKDYNDDINNKPPVLHENDKPLSPDDNVVCKFKSTRRSKPKNKKTNCKGKKVPETILKSLLESQFVESDSDYSVGSSNFSSDMSDVLTDDSDSYDDVSEAHINQMYLELDNMNLLNNNPRRIIEELTNHIPITKSKIMLGFYDYKYF